MAKFWDVLRLNSALLLQNDLARSSATILIIRAVNVVSASLLSIILVRALGLHGYGFYALYMSIFALVSLPITSGMPTFIVKEVAPMFVQNNGSQIRSVIRFALGAASIYMCLLATCLFLAWYLHVARDYRVFGILLWFHVAIQIINACRSAVLRAVGRIVKGQLIDRLIQPSLAVTFTAIWWALAGNQFTVLEALLALLASNALCLSLGAHWVRQELHGLKPGTVIDKAESSYFITLLNLSGVGLLNSTFTNGVTLIVGWVGSIESAAIYRIAASVAIILNYLQEVMIQVVAPKIAHLWYEGEKRRIVNILMVGAVINTMTIGLGTVVIATFGHGILRIAFGPQYQEAYLALVILSFSNLAYALGGYRDLLLNMSGHAKESFRVSLVLVPVSLMLATLGVLEFAEIGAAAAVLFFQMAASLWLAFSTEKLTGINPSIFGLFSNRNLDDSGGGPPTARDFR